MQLTQLDLASHVPDIVIWSVFTSLLALFLDVCFKENNIFEGWLNFLAKWWLKKNNPQILQDADNKTDDEVIAETGGKYETVREWVFSKVEWFWFKPLGGCVVCMNVWISFGFLFTQSNFISMLAMVLLSNFLTRFANGKLLS